MNKSLKLTTKDKAFLLALVLLTFITFHRAFTAGYIDWDDHIFIVDNTTLDQPFVEATKLSFERMYLYDYLPLPLMSYWAENQIWGRNPHEQHLVNLALHGLNIVLLFCLMLLLGFGRLWSFAIATIFAVHPVQTEPIMWISSRNTIFATTFLLLTGIISRKLISNSGSRALRVAMIICFAASFLCKATGFLFPLILATADHFIDKIAWKKIVSRYAPLLAVALGFFILRAMLYASGASGQVVTADFFEQHRLMRIPFISSNALFEYVRMAFWPFGYSIVYPTFKFATRAWGIMALVLCALAGLFYLYRKKQRGDLLFFLSWIILFLLPVLHVFPRNNYVNDRYMYLPIAGFAGLALTTASAFKLRDRSYKLLSKAALIFIAALPFFSYTQTKIWANNLTLWQNAVRRNPDSAFSHNKLGEAYQALGDFDHAFDQYQAAFQAPLLDANPGVLFVDMGSVFADRLSAHYDPAKAEQIFREGLAHSGAGEYSYQLRYNLAVVLSYQKKNSEAVEVLRSLRVDLSEAKDMRYKSMLLTTEESLRKLGASQ